MNTYSFTVENLDNGVWYDDTMKADTLQEAVTEICRTLPENYNLVAIEVTE